MANEGYLGIEPKSALEGTQGAAQSQDQTITIEQAKAKISEVLRNPEHPYHSKFAGRFGSGHEEAVTEMQRLYGIVYAEPEGRQDMPNSGERGLSDRLREEGLQTKEQIEAEGEEGRQKIADEVFEKETDDCETALKVEWGSQGYEERLGLAHALADTYFSEEDFEWLETPGPNGMRPGNDPEFVKRLSDLADYLISKGYSSSELRKYRRKEKSE